MPLDTILPPLNSGAWSGNVGIRTSEVVNGERGRITVDVRAPEFALVVCVMLISRELVGVGNLRIRATEFLRVCRSNRLLPH